MKKMIVVSRSTTWSWSHAVPHERKVTQFYDVSGPVSDAALRHADMCRGRADAEGRLGRGVDAR